MRNRLLLAAALLLAGCAPPGMDPKVADAFKQKYLNGDKPPPAEQAEAEEPEAPPPPPPPPIVSPPAEGLTITGISLTGYWRLNTYLQMSVSIGPFHKGKTDLGEMADRDICEFTQIKRKIKTSCLRKAFASSAGGSVDEDELTLEWSTGPGTLIYEGHVGGDGRVEGGMGVGVMGVRVSDLVPANLYKLSPSAAAPGPAPIEAALRNVLADLDRGALTETRYSKDALALIQKGMVPKGRLVGIGLPESLLYLGTILHKRPKEPAEKAVSVFEIHSAGKKTLCGVSLGEDGLVTDFMCAGSDQA